MHGENLLSSSYIHAGLVKTGEDISLVSIKRELSRMAGAGMLTVSGKGRASSYGISITGRMASAVDAAAYCAMEPDKRYGLGRFSFDLFTAWPVKIFFAAEENALEHATDIYQRRTTDLPPAIAEKELERVIIELSWKSSKIEGNTYTLLDTEKLILEHREAPGHDKKEAVLTKQTRRTRKP